ncbi:ABC transporter [Carpediemonas membranifera]|uniref:ABC transporter n=1 Tax=Carpediemonas membranifera TaxID=201153 RepID=A0A8J6B0N7_9EUKA|nr:ABC transporter [Carpediemonas membranifera]|eukprot:KAG9390419.1 ABC transporter [Carpediemonas membranifera]
MRLFGRKRSVKTDTGKSTPTNTRPRMENPAKHAGFVQLLLFSYLGGFFSLARRNTITSNDLYLPMPKYTSYRAYMKLLRGFNRSRVLSFGKIPRKFKIARAIFFDLAVPTYFAIILVIIGVVAQYTYTAMITPFTRVLEGDYNVYTSTLIVAAMACVPFITAFCNTHAMTVSMRVGRSVEVSVKSLIMQKLGKVSAGLQAALSSGKLIQISMTDVQSIQRFFQQLTNLVTVPISLLANFIIMVWMLGWLPAVLSIVILVVLIPLAFSSTILIFVGFFKKMKLAGERVKWITEVLNGIQTIKVQAWEDSFAGLVAKLRARELRAMVFSLAGFTFQNVVTSTFPVIVIFFTLLGYELVTGNIDTARLYTVMSLAFQLQGPFRNLPQALNALVQSLTSLRRVQAFLELPEIEPESMDHTVLPHGTVILEGTFAWLWRTDIVPKILKEKRQNKADAKEAKKERASQRSTSGATTPNDAAARGTGLKGKERGNFRLSIPGPITVPHMALVHITAPVAAGKSALLHAVLGEMRRVDPTPSLADLYDFTPVPRSACMHGGSVSYCSQDPWLTTKSIRDNIVMHEPWDEDRYRSVLFAACLGPDLEVLDHKDMTLVGEHGLTLSGGQKARVNLARCLYRKADVYVIDDPLAAVDAHVCEHIITHALGTFLADKTVLVASHRDVPADMQITITREHVVSLNEEYSPRSLEPAEPDLTSLDNLIQSTDSGAENTHTSEEAVHRNVTFKTYLRLISLGGGIPIVIAAACCLLLAQLSFSGVSFWITAWSNWPDFMSWHCWLLGIFIIGSVMVVGNTTRSVTLFSATIRVSSHLHKTLVKRVMSAPMSFFETVPVGRIVNRFSTDIGLVDLSLQLNLTFFLVMVVSVVFTLVSMVFVMPGIIIVVVPVIVVYLYIMRTVKSPFIQLRRLQGSSNSPVVSHFSETMSGITTIRAHEDVANNQRAAQDLMDGYLTPVHAFIDCQSFVFLWTQILGAILSAGVVIIAIPMSQLIGVSLSMLAVTNLYSVSMLFVFVILMYVMLESDLASFDRVCEYADSLPSEGGPTTAPPASWPDDGSLHIDNLSYRYRPNLPLALKDVSVDIHSGSKIGIVGRSGAGKSTFIAALLRLAQPEPGSKVVIGGMDAADVPINALRKAIAIIPQSPVLFSGKLRMNLDPFNRYADDKLFEVLNSVMLEKYADKEGLAHQVIQGGSNLSVGERQLVCLARALLQQSRIILIDEATASVDFATDEILQRTLRTSTVGATAIVVAHRLETIADSDLIMLIDDGKLAECGQPKTLLEDDTGKFTSLVKRANAGKAFGMEEEGEQEEPVAQADELEL